MKKIEDIEKKNIYKVPGDYFENLPDKILARIKEKETRKKTISLWPKEMIKYAAILILMIGVASVIFYINHQKPEEEVLSQNIDRQAIAEYLKTESITTDDILLSLSESELPQGQIIDEENVLPEKIKISDIDMDEAYYVY